jgi:hypothetical protein
MTNEIAAALIFILWLLDGRRINLCLAIFIYYLAIIAISGEPVYYYYPLATLIDLSIIVLICFLSIKYRQSVALNACYCAIILISMSLSGLTLLDQASGLNRFPPWHELFNEWIIYIDLCFVLMGAHNVRAWIANRFLPFGVR